MENIVPLLPEFKTCPAVFAVGTDYQIMVPVKSDVLFWVTLITTIAVTVVGAWTSNIMEKYWGEDPRTVVIDEFIGIWIPALVAPCGENTWLLAILGFVAFRIIDIFKPLGCRWVDQNVKGGWGVMLDDALAGFYSLIICLIVKQFL